MRPQCINAVQTALGRGITVAETRNIETRIRDAMKREAIRDPVAWATYGTADRLRMAAQLAGKELVEEANLKALRVARQIEAWDRIENHIAGQLAAGHDATPLAAMERTLAPINDGKNNIVSVESSAKGIEAAAMGGLVKAWESVKPRFLGLFASKKMEDAFILEAHGFDTGNPIIKAGVKAWQEQVDLLRQRFNNGGGHTGKLDNWGMPHSWSARLSLKATQASFVDDFIRWVDRSKYVHEDGALFTDAEMRDFLGEAWRTIATEGANKTRPEPMPGGAMKANRNGEHRQIHFKDGPSALSAFRKYSERNLFQTLSGHVSRMAKDIALIETWGPSSDHAFETMLNKSYADTAQPGMKADADEIRARVSRLYEYLAGNGAPPLENWLARGGRDLRAWLGAAKLGSAPVTAIGDQATAYLTARVNGLPMMRLFFNELRALNPANRLEQRLARRAGLMVQTMQNDVNRYAADSMGPRWSSQMSAMFHRLSGLNALTEATRRAFSTTMMDTLGSLTRRYQNVAGLAADDWKFLKGKGIDQKTWEIWRDAQPEKWGGNHQVLTAESIMTAPGQWSLMQRHQAATKLMAIVLEEQDIAVIEPGARERAGMSQTQAGTFQGELMRSIFLFKSFPHAMIKRHIERGIKAYDGMGGKAGYIGSLLALTTVFGAVAQEINDVLSGRDPRNLNPMEPFGARNWLSAMLKGGAFGIYGDFLFGDNTQFGRTLLETMAGPVFGTVAEADALTRGNLIQMMKGEDPNFGAEATQFMRGVLPGANLWYTKAALDHLIFQNMQEMFSPGYLARMKATQQQRSGTTYWWAPGQDIDQARAPNVSNIVGEK